jgi:L-ascorbate metabolism protein UlaG (beta-lactamase superfamily)
VWVLSGVVSSRATDVTTTPLQFYGLGTLNCAAWSADGTKIVTDPYTPDARLKYTPVSESADIVTISHEHGDHNNLASVKGSPQAVRGVTSTTIKGIEIKGFPTYHDEAEGKGGEHHHPLGGDAVHVPQRGR